MTFSSPLILYKIDMSRPLIEMMTSLMKATSSLLFLIIECLEELTFSSIIGIVMVKGAWLDVRHQSGWIEWLFNSNDTLHQNMRSMTKFESLELSEYLVRTWLVGIDKSRLNKSAIIIRSLLIVKWYGKDRSQRLSQMLKLSVIIRRLQTFASVSLRYFKTKWKESEQIFIIQKMLLLLKNETRRISLWSITSFWSKKQNRRKSEVNINNNSWIIVCWVQFSCKCKPIGIISDTH